MESVVEEVFEIQSFQPFVGWHFERFCDRAGNTFGVLTKLASALIAQQDDRLNSLGWLKENAGVGFLPDDQWMWSHPWMPDCDYTQCDEHGWSYGSSIGGINRRLAGGTSKSKKLCYHFIRRRRWIRTRVKKPPEMTNVTTASASTSTLERQGSSLMEKSWQVVDDIDDSSEDDDDDDDDDDENGQVTPNGTEIVPASADPATKQILSEPAPVTQLSPASPPSKPLSTSNIEDRTHLRHKRFYNMRRDGLFAHFRLGSVHHLGRFLRVEYVNEDVMQEGWLGERSSFARWKLRYFILRSDSSSLVCLRDLVSLLQVRETFIDRHTSVIAEESANPQQCQFLVVNHDHTIRLNAFDTITRSAWMSAISELIVRSRASFLAAEDTEIISSCRSMIRSISQYRRQRSSFSDEESDFRIRWQPRDSDRRQSRKAWRPYRMCASTMIDKHAADDAFWTEYLQQFQADISENIELAQSFVLQNTAMLEGIYESSFMLGGGGGSGSTPGSGTPSPTPTPTPPSRKESFAVAQTSKIQELRDSIIRSFSNLQDQVNQAMASSSQVMMGALQCNSWRKKLYEETERLNLMLLSFAQSNQLTVKPKAHMSPRNRIPTDWFGAGDSPQQQQPKKASPQILEESQGTASSSVSQGVQFESQFQQFCREISSHEAKNLKNGYDVLIRRGSMDKIRRTMTRRHSSFNGFTKSPQSLRSAESRASSDETDLSYHGEAWNTLNDATTPESTVLVMQLPQQLCVGHLELPSGVNDWVVLVDEKDFGSLIAFVLSSRTYASELQTHLRSFNMDLGRELREEQTRVLDKQAMFKARQAEYLLKLRSNDFQHADMRFSFEKRASKRTVRCVTFFAAQFHALRRLVKPGNASFLNSICKSNVWQTSGGKSGAFFSISHDKRFVLKGIPLTEFNMFLHMAPQYFKFMSRVVEVNSPTIITKILGLYKITKSRRLHKRTTYVVVMENFSYGFDKGQLYDLKGILRRRHQQSHDEKDDLGDHESSGSDGEGNSRHSVLMDGDFAERIPVPVRQNDLNLIETAIQNDTAFLCRAGVIDYSLMLLFDEKKRKVVMGLIDYLHQFDFLKKMESTSKASLTFRNPTIISPVAYRRRIIDAMHRYLVGIEVDLELRIQKRKRSEDKKKQQHQLGSSVSHSQSESLLHSKSPSASHSPSQAESPCRLLSAPQSQSEAQGNEEQEQDKDARSARLAADIGMNHVAKSRLEQQQQRDKKRDQFRLLLMASSPNVLAENGKGGDRTRRVRHRNSSPLMEVFHDVAFDRNPPAHSEGEEIDSSYSRTSNSGVESPNDL